MNEYVFEGSGGRMLRCYQSEVENPSAVVVVVHGMQEHALRYEWFAMKLKENNIAMFISDLRGHGKNIVENKPGLDGGDIYEGIVEDYKIFISKMKEKYPKAKLVLFGHSYGSFVVQRFVRDYPSIADKFVICGSSYMNTLLVKSARVIAGLSRLFKGREADAKLVEALSIRSYGKGFDGGNWLSRDESVWERYNKDPLCGKVFPVAFYQSMFKNLPKNYKGLKKHKKCAPILLIAGDNDPVGAMGKGVKKLYDVYKKAGLDVKLKLYEGARHELLNETNKMEVFGDILEWVNKD